MNKVTLKAEKRKVLGRKVKSLRKEGFLPANIYGKKVKSEAVKINLDEFEKIYKEAGETSLIELQLDGDKKPVLIHEVQLDPVSGLPIHADLLQVDLKEKVVTTIPVEVEGESPVEKSGAGTVVLQLDEIEVEALPTDLPEKFVIDANLLVEVDQTILVKDLNFDKAKVEIKTDLEQIVVKVEPPQKEEVVTPPAPAEGEEVPAEGESPQTPTETPKEENKEETPASE